MRIAFGLALVALPVVLMAPTAATAGSGSKNVYAGGRDCTPINGRSGYYGNPWCGTGPYPNDQPKAQPAASTPQAGTHVPKARRKQ